MRPHRAAARHQHRHRIGPPHSAPAANAPQTFANGRYEVVRFLGEGGRKKVYLARDTVLDRQVAFALIKMEGLDDAARVRIMREAQTMGRLGNHPNLVTVFDIGEHTDEAGVTQPWIAIELLPGGDVEGLLKKAGGAAAARAHAAARASRSAAASSSSTARASCTATSSRATSG